MSFNKLYDIIRALKIMPNFNKENCLMKFIKHIFTQHKIPAVTILSLLALIVLVKAFAIGSPYGPGDTLDPACAPGDTNCFVRIFPDQTSNAGKFLKTDGSVVSWDTVAAGVTGSGTTNYVPKWSSSTVLGNSVIYDDGTNVGIGTTNMVSSAALKIKGRLIVSTQEVTNNDNYNAMLEVGIGNGVLFSNSTNGATANNQLGYIFGDEGLQIYGRNNLSTNKFIFSGKASANRMELYSDDANDSLNFLSNGVVNHTQVFGNDGFNLIKDNAATTTAATYSALSVVNSNATANRLSIIGFTNSANVARNAFIGARFIDANNGELFLGTKSSGVESIGVTLDKNGNVSIGTATPFSNSLLSVNGSISMPASGFLRFNGLARFGVVPADSSFYTSILASGSGEGINFLNNDGTVKLMTIADNSGGEGRVGIGFNYTADPSAVLDVQSTTKGFKVPRMTAAQASALPTGPIDALILYVTDTDATFTSIGFWGYENGTWIKL